MSCCGSKRAQLWPVQGAPASPDGGEPASAPAARERKTRTFEYVGRGGLSVRGAVSGVTYRFRRPGDRLEVAHDDAFAMMAERDVRPR